VVVTAIGGQDGEVRICRKRIARDGTTGINLTFLDPEEQELYQFLLTNNKRFEQERIPQQYVFGRLGAII